MHEARRPAPAPDGQPAALTPMMAQFFEIKSANPGFLLFYRMGDFYELFFEDAEIASAALGIVLTRRGKHLGEDVLMCGVPVHAAQEYLKKLIALGHRVAVCEQVEDPAEARKRGSKSVVRRDVVRLVTRGTLTEDDLLPARGSNFLASLAMVRHGEADFALAWADVSTGETEIADLVPEALSDALARVDPAELLLTETTRLALLERHLLPPVLAQRITIVPPESFDSAAAGTGLRDWLAPHGADPSAFSRPARAALWALFAYVRESQKGRAPVLGPPGRGGAVPLMAIDQATRNSLELFETQRGATKGALRQAIDLTVTPGGARLFAQRLAAPLREAGPINARLDAVSRLVGDSLLVERLRTGLRAAPDLARALTRLALERGGPRDLAAIGEAVGLAAALGARLAGAEDLPAALAAITQTLADAPAALAGELSHALVESPPLLARDGGFTARGYDETLDAERALGSATREVVAALQSRLAEETGVRALKIRHNGVLGYFVEVPAAQGGKLLEEPFRADFIHRQTLANAMRFTTAELGALEMRIARAHEAALEIEMGIFARLSAAVLAETDRLRALAEALAELDVFSALAHLAATRGYARPEIEDSLAFEITGGRHPVVEEMLSREGQSFIANDCDLTGDMEAGGGRIWLVTGPNMGGKSTYLRQNALIAIMAQAGSFVPAARARIGTVDRVFSRVGASDDIAHGRSTFMVEMVETAAILNRATGRSLVVLDEIGRGTATFDGLSIAWATVESLHETTGCRALFATHFHELTSLAKSLARVANVTMKVREWESEVVFLHEVGAGAADRSYGIQVARLAGLPEPVLARARAVLGVLEQRASGALPSAPLGAVLDDLPLFAHQPPPSRPEPRSDPVHDLLASIHPDDVTPKDALELLYKLKTLGNAARRS